MIEKVNKDRNGRVFVEGLDVNAEMLRHGTARVFLKYARYPSLIPIEREAQREERGLWELPEEQ